MTTVLYIAGYGRSGSTLLELLLQDRTGGTGYGELVHLRDEVVGRKTYGGGVCSCGEPLEACVEWSGVAAELQNGLPVKDLYSRFLNERFAADPGLVIDSSKTTRKTVRHFLRMRQHVTKDIRVVHLSRRPSDVYRSWSKHQNRPNGAGQRRGLFHRIGFVASYVYAELAARTIVRWLSRHSTSMTFEELTQDPQQAWVSIAAALNLDLGDATGTAITNHGHGIAGNRLRHQEGAEIEIEPNRSGDAASPSVLLRALDRVAR